MSLAFFIIGSYIGLIILDEDSQFEFGELSDEALDKLSITEKQLEIYNSEINEVNLIFNEVTASLDENSTIDDSISLWNEMSELVSPETMTVVRAITSQN